MADKLSKPASISDFVLGAAGADEASIDEILQDALRTIRVHLDMDVAFISEFLDGRRYFRHVDAAAAKAVIVVGASDPLDQSYCQCIVDGRLPRLIHDARQIPLARTMPATMALPVGAHISVPIQFSDGRIYGTFCCFKMSPDPTLLERDLELVQIFAEFTGKQLERQITARRSYDELRQRIQSVIDTQNFTIVYQPIYNVGTGKVVGFESLTRFSALPIRTPNLWFEEAARVELIEALETTVIEKALQGLDQLPKDVYISLNVSPTTILSGAMSRVLRRAHLKRIVLEITEHISISDYTQLTRVLQPLRNKGLRLAVDDAGAGYASFRHILSLEPDLIKLDISLTRDIDTDRTRRALAAALIRFAQETGSRIIAEGVETQSEFNVLRHLRIDKAQGYLIGRPVPLAHAIAFAQA